MTQPHAAMAPSDPIVRALDAVRARVLSNRDGEVASYIPELARADPEGFGLVVVSLGGNVYAAGECDVPFTIQSISKPFVLALALTELGIEAFTARVGLEPSGKAFNAISLDPVTGRPANPLINAGAILTSSLVPAAGPTERFDRILRFLSAFAGRDLDVDEDVYRSESATGSRNRALAYLMSSAGALDAAVEATVDVYFRQCSVLVSTIDVAVMAATLANGGRNPVTDERVIDALTAERVMSVMATCGMYDDAGDWLVRVGLPAKSGVSGGLVAVSPGQFGIGLHSPRLDERGNSVRAVAAARALSEDFSLHLLHRPARTAPVVFVDEVPVDPDGAAPAPLGSTTVVSLHGDLEFAAAELALRAVDDLRSRVDESGHLLVLDLDEVTDCHPVAVALLESLAMELEGRRVRTVVVDGRRRGLLQGVAPEFASRSEARR